MWEHLWLDRSAYARRWLIGAVLVQTVLFAIAAFFPDREWFFWYGNWANREVMVFASMALLLAGAFAMHEFDQKKNGWGFRHVYRADDNGSHQIDEQKYVGSILTVESIRAAMIAAILAALLSERARYLPPGETPHRLPWLAIPAEPGAVFFVLVTAALASALVTTMAALLCYEYATRFVWRQSSAKAGLARKAFELGKFGFYCLMWSLAVLPALLDYQLTFVSILFVFAVMWLYYFFPVPGPEPRQEITGP